MCFDLQHIGDLKNQKQNHKKHIRQLENPCSICHRFHYLYSALPGATYMLYLRATMCVSKSAFVYLLLVLPLQVNPGLDVTSRLLEGLSLGDLGRVVGADPDYISAQEDQHVGADLSARSSKEQTQQRGRENDLSIPPKCINVTTKDGSKLVSK